ncbi:homocysteine S-methyltransferase [Dongia mobilis]|uniref:Homocysteine S-methyltransferase n=1 Tax=Dongia mobilis TaxID=578943 RepID=A0A4V3DF41_9PROT|nr:homocysteine S-methyltransferase family protein [Dongia mobilis]TDQ84551.1 homocysteine S-methyltransferase [Dongia mobilis]
MTDRAGIVLLDGGMGRELNRMGAPFRQPEWSALALIEGPDFVRRAHAAFIAAGAEVITTNSYAVVPFHIGEERFRARGEELADLAGRLARQAATESGRKVRVAGSLPPLFGSYRPDLFKPAEAQALLKPLIAGLSPHVDLWLAETQSAIAEAREVAKALKGDTRPRWFSFTLHDEHPDPKRPALRSGESVVEAVRFAGEAGAAALLFNCSQPEVMGHAIDVARAEAAKLGLGLKIGCYANAFPPQSEDAEANGTLSDIRADLDPKGYLAFARDWQKRGADMIGGCCGIGPEHIAAIKAALR